MLGLVVFLGLEAAHVFETESSLPVAIFMIFISIGAPIFVFAGIRKGKYDITTYNHENSFETKALNNKIGKICGVLMMSMTLIYLCLGFLLELWETAWVVFPIGGILCGIISMILRKDN